MNTQKENTAKPEKTEKHPEITLKDYLSLQNVKSTMCAIMSSEENGETPGKAGEE